MLEPIDDVSNLLVPMSSRGLFDTAIRLQPDVDPARAMAAILRQLEAVSHLCMAAVEMYVEPTGDSCDTGNWVDVHCYYGTVWADITPRPQQFGGTIPRQIDSELELAGWVVTAEQPDVPENPASELVAQPTDYAIGEGPMRRLVTSTEPAELEEWCELVTHAVARVIHPTARQWYLHASVTIPEIDPTLELEGRPIRSGQWHIDIGACLDPAEWSRAVWRPDTEAGAMACDLGLHHLHEPPCPPPAPWMGR